ncbi:MAG: L,D-transpeptidase family protein, partial [Bacteroides acidifaciens]|nr:L,D-transpeptidase family protein [Bacteroides acidifaciens]
MKSKRLLWRVIIVCAVCLAACKKEKPLSPIPDSLASLQELLNPAYQISSDSIHLIILSYLNENKQATPWDSALVAHYQENNDFFWLNDSLVSDKPAVQAADSMLYWLENISQHGVNPRLYPTDSIRKELQQIRTLQLRDGKTMNRLLADVEYQLTAAYLSYVCKLKFGFLPLGDRWNDSINRIPLKNYDKDFAMAALDSLRMNANMAFHQAQPSSRLYLKMQEELERVNAWGKTDTTDYYRDRLLVNMERARWQYALEKGKKYVVANVAAFMLQAINEETDSILEMRICVGSVKNKTPLLSSRIYYMELNPYWNVPQSIIRKEIIPTYRRDTTYFTRNRMKVYDNKTGLQVDPHSIKWAKYAGRGVPYTVKQDNKTGNSLGRIIFRFPNPHSVYLHDTPSRWAFTRKNRAVSQG